MSHREFVLRLTLIVAVAAVLVAGFTADAVSAARHSCYVNTSARTIDIGRYCKAKRVIVRNGAVVVRAK